MTIEVLQDIKSTEFPSLSSIYLNAAYRGPLPERSRALGLTAIARAADPSFWAYNEWRTSPEKTRRQFASLLGCESANVAHSTSVSEIISHLANGFPFETGDVVATSRAEYPADVLPWMLAAKHREFTHEFFSPELLSFPKKLVESLHPKTRVICFSHVCFATGRRVDLAELTRLLKEREIFVIVDATQSIGGMAITNSELRNVDVLAASTYKWLLGPYGHAFGYFSDRALSTVRRTHANWLASPNVENTTDLLRYTTDVVPGAQKFDRGQTPTLTSLSMLEGSLSLLEDIGLEVVEQHNQMLVREFVSNLPTRYARICQEQTITSNIVCISNKAGNTPQLVAKLRDKNIDVSIREDNVRISFHLFNAKEDVANLLAAL